MVAILSFPLLAYVDASAAVAVALEEPGWEQTARRLTSFPVLLSANLLEAEVRSVYAREGLKYDPSVVSSIGLVHPHRSLGPELAKALEIGGYLKGADLWHMAIALYVKGADLWHMAITLYVDETIIGRTAFVTLDNKQRAVAANLGFAT